MEWINWLVSIGRTKPVVLVILFVVFLFVLFYVYGNKKRGERLESYKNMPFLDDESETKEDRK